MTALLWCSLLLTFLIHEAQLTPVEKDPKPVYLDPCRSPKDSGPCDAIVPRYYYNQETHECQSFNYGGCQGNNNNFPTKEHCEGVCVNKSQHPCHEVKKVGPCMAAFLRYHFNPSTSRCEEFIYGGCQGNSNNFKSLEECVLTCNPPKESKEARCSQPVSSGLCLAAFPRYHFDTQTSSCKQFIYGGCGGNSNNFKTSEECEAACAPPTARTRAFSVPVSDIPKRTEPADFCNDPPEKPSPVSCLAYFEKYTFDSKLNECVKHIYGGCHGTKNLFNTEEQCYATCQPNRQEVDPCSLEKDQGPCFARKIRFYFNKEKNACDVFYYGGCRGNKNNFNSLEECQNRCGGQASLEDVIESLCDEAICDQRSYKNYLAMGCKPKRRRGECCPSSWICEHEHHMGDCMHNGTHFKIGDKVPSEDPCAPVCQCRAADEEQPEPHVHCDRIACNYPVNNDPNCKIVFKPGQCCPSLECDNKDKHVCVVDGVSYTEGQKMSFKDKPCRTCICSKDYANTDSKGCTDVFCGFQEDGYRHRGCTPVYLPGVCCASKWVCPDEAQARRIDVEKDACLQPKHEGPCEAHIPRFYYDPKTQSCLGMIYGGCQGNQNNFESAAECASLCGNVKQSDICRLEAETGPCKASMRRWYFNKNTHSCQTFIYGGCQGNQNNFRSKQECEDSCLAKDESGAPQTRARSIEKDICDIPPETGPCKMRKQQYYFDKKTGNCDLFIYGGCMGNANRFQTKDECLAKCSPNAILRTQPPVVNNDPCSQPKESGPCRALKERFYYNKDENACQEFIYGGCEGNLNNFLRQEECESLCVKQETEAKKGMSQEEICKLPPEVGRCKAKMLRYHYDPADQTCKPFFYGGCYGNENRFLSEEECKSKCHDEKIEVRAMQISDAVDFCAKPPEVGICKARVQRYFFDPSDGQCKTFIYGGCQGNENNFRTIEECQNICIEKKIVTERTLPTNRAQKICQLPSETGVCKARKMRYHFDIDSQSCKLFTYGGCGGNENNFVSIEDCWNTCIAATGKGNNLINTDSSEFVCKLPAEPGPCRKFDIRYYYNPQEGMCMSFTYGGCMGNANNFETLEECTHQCGQNTDEDTTKSLECKFGNSTIPYGKTVQVDNDPCTKCTCKSPPELSCEMEMCAIPLISKNCRILPPRINECCERVVCDREEEKKKQDSLGCDPKCPAGEFCIEQKEDCGTSECEIRNVCVRGEDLCGSIVCPEHEECFLQNVLCLRPPCPPVPQCRPKPAPPKPCPYVRCRPGCSSFLSSDGCNHCNCKDEQLGEHHNCPTINCPENCKAEIVDNCVRKCHCDDHSHHH